MFMGAGGGLHDEAAAGVAKEPASGSSFIPTEGRGPRQMVPCQTSNTTLIGTRDARGLRGEGCRMRGGGRRLCPCALISCVLVKRPVLITCTVYEACGWQQEKHH